MEKNKTSIKANATVTVTVTDTYLALPNYMQEMIVEMSFSEAIKFNAEFNSLKTRTAFLEIPREFQEMVVDSLHGIAIAIHNEKYPVIDESHKVIKVRNTSGKNIQPTSNAQRALSAALAGTITDKVSFDTWVNAETMDYRIQYSQFKAWATVRGATLA